MTPEQASTPTHRAKPLARGFTLIEFMVSMALGLALVACALLAWAHHLRETQHQVTQARLTHELRTTAQFMANNIRRSGYNHQADQNIAMPTPTLSVNGPELRLQFSHAHPSSNQLAYRLHQGAIQVKWGAGSWQAMTHEKNIRITQFNATPQTHVFNISTNNCSTTQEVALVHLNLQAHATQDPSVTQTLQTTLRVHNDALATSCGP